MSTFKFQHIDIIGLGGTGSALLYNLVRLCIYHERIADKAQINLFDGDIIEDKNLTRAFSSTNINKSKVEASIENLNQHFHAIDRYNQFDIVAHPQYINEDYYLELLLGRTARSHTLSLVCVDNDPTRGDIVRAIKASNKWVAFMSPGNNEDDGQVVCWVQAGKNKDICPYPLDIYDQWVNADMTSHPGSCSYKYSTSPQLMLTNNFAAMCTLSNVQLLLDGGMIKAFSSFSIYETKVDSGKPYKVYSIPSLEKEVAEKTKA